MSENKKSCDGRRVTPPRYDSLKQEGDYYFKFNPGDGKMYLHAFLPGPEFCAIPVKLGAPVNPGPWGWDGNEDKPTIQPSIHLVGHWHGHFHAGRFISYP